MARPNIRRALVAVVLALPSACTVDRSDPQEGRSDPLESFDVSHTPDELTATLERGDAFVVVKFRKGRARPSEWRRDPMLDSPHLFDLAVMDRNGAALILQLGGDTLIDPDWTALVIPPPATGTLEERHDDILLAQDLLDRLDARVDVARLFEWEIESMRITLDHTLREVSFTGPEQLDARPTPDRSEAIPLLASGSILPEPPPPLEGEGGYTHAIWIRWSSCCWTFANHSAVEIRTYNASDLWIATIVTGNHGRQANHPSMITAVGCPQAWSGRFNTYPPAQPYLATDTAWEGDAGGCETPYGLTAAKHICNDDTLAQFYNVQNNSALATWVTCGDGMLRAIAPDCYY